MVRQCLKLIKYVGSVIRCILIMECFYETIKHPSICCTVFLECRHFFMTFFPFPYRFSSVTERFFMELNTRRIDTSVSRSETLSIINGMRYLKLGVCKLIVLVKNWMKRQWFNGKVIARLRLRVGWMHQLLLWQKQTLLSVQHKNVKVSFTMLYAICFQTS